MTTHGADFPPEIMKIFAAHEMDYLANPGQAHLWDPAVIGVPGGPVSCLLLFHTGRRSGKRLHCVLQYYVRDREIAIVASKGGAPSHPSWYLNLCADPHCEVWIGEHKSAATARHVAPSARAYWWSEIKAEQPAQVEYERRTAREIPILILELATPLPRTGG